MRFLKALEEVKAQERQVTYNIYLDHFLLFLLTLLLIWPYYCFSSYFGTVSLVIGEVESRGREIAVGFFRYFSSIDV